MKPNFLKGSLLDAGINILLQVTFRCLTFVLNAFVIRHVNPDAVGVMYVRLLLLESTLLFLCRDPFWKACLSKSEKHNWPQVINLVWMTVPLCALLSIVFGYVWLYMLVPPDESTTKYYTFGVLVMIFSCIIEMCSEPLRLIAQAFLYVKLKATAEMGMVFIRTIVFVCIIWRDAEKAVFGFSVAQFMSVLLYVCIYYGFFHYQLSRQDTLKKEQLPVKSFRDLFPKRLKDQDQIDKKLMSLTWGFMKQGIMMQILTEGEKYVMTLFNVLSFAEQGVFDVVNNLGSLAARFLFRPIEESSYFYFTQLVHRDQCIKDQNKTSMAEAALVLEYLLKLVSSVGLCVFCFGQSYAQMALYLYGGTKLSSSIALVLFRTHCLAILLIAVNGSTECYTLSTMNTQQLDRRNRMMVLLSMGFLLVAWILSYLLGSIGFILANCLNMMTRIICSVRFIKERYDGTQYNPLNGLKPKLLFSIFLIVSTVITSYSEVYIFERSLLLHFAVGAVCSVLTILIWIFEEKELIKYAMKAMNSKQL